MEATAYLSPNPCQTTRGKFVDACFWAPRGANGCCTGDAVTRFAERASAKKTQGANIAAMSLTDNEYTEKIMHKEWEVDWKLKLKR